MKCLTPAKVARGTVPCGGCLICRKYRGLCWTARILLEQAYTPNLCWFTTLTYNDDNVPVTLDYIENLNKKEATSFHKNYKQRHADIKVYLVGEYGDESKRPHYHAALFPQTSEFNINHYMQAWQRRGWASAYPLQGNRAAYLAKYTVKKLTSYDDERLCPGQEPEFRTSSREPAIGLAALPSLEAAYHTRPGAKLVAERGDIERSVRIDGRVYPLDDYMKFKLRSALGIPVTHEERLTHKGYYECHQNTQHDENPELYQLEVHRHRQKTLQKQAQTHNV